MSSCIPWLSSFYTSSDAGDCGKVDCDSVDSGDSDKSCPSQDSAEDNRRQRRWLRRGRCGSKSANNDLGNSAGNLNMSQMSQN